MHDHSSGSQRVLSPSPTEHTLRDLRNGYDWAHSDHLHPTQTLSHSLGDGHSCPGVTRGPLWPGIWGRAPPESCAMGQGVGAQQSCPNEVGCITRKRERDAVEVQ